MPDTLVGRVTSVDSDGNIFIESSDIGKWPVGSQIVVVDDDGQRVATVKVTDVTGGHLTARYFGGAKDAALEVSNHMAVAAAAAALAPIFLPFLPVGMAASSLGHSRRKRAVLSRIKQGMLVYELPASEIPGYSPNRYESAVEKYRPHSA